MSSAQSDAEWSAEDREHDEKRLAEMDAQLAAKDAEIAELRAKLSTSCDLHFNAMQQLAYAQSMLEDERKTARLLGAELREADQRAESYMRERDEARECVTRLYQCLSALVKDAPKDEPERPDTYNTDGHAEWAIDWDLWHMAKTAHDALAATPEHLRGAA